MSKKKKQKHLERLKKAARKNFELWAKTVPEDDVVGPPILTEADWSLWDEAFGLVTEVFDFTKSQN